LPHFTASLEKLFSLVNHVKTKTNLLKMKKMQNKHYQEVSKAATVLACQQWSMVISFIGSYKMF